jgi:putative transposase
MRKLLKSYKTEINPTLEQIQKINKTIGTCRFIYNFYLAHNKELHDKGEKFMTAKSFSVWLNNEFIPNNPEFLWIKEVSSKSVKKSMENACTAFSRFFKKQSKFPRFKKKNKSDVKMYFVKNNPKDCFCERHRINIPTLGWVKLKEKGYIPTTKQGYVIKSGTISYKAGKYYVSVLIDIPEVEKSELNDFGLGIDLGVKEFAVKKAMETSKRFTAVKLKEITQNFSEYDFSVKSGKIDIKNALWLSIFQIVV